MRWCWLTCTWNLGCLGSYAHEALSVACPRLSRKTMVWCGVFQTSAISGLVMFYLSSLTDCKVVTGLWCWLHDMENVQGLAQVCICQCDWLLCSLVITGGAGWLWERVLSHEAICWVSSEVNFISQLLWKMWSFALYTIKVLELCVSRMGSCTPSLCAIFITTQFAGCEIPHFFNLRWRRHLKMLNVTS
jgi:hypothetical protein